MIDATHPKLSIARQCDLIGLSRSSFYRQTIGCESEENLQLMALIDEEYMRHPFYGSRKMCVYLQGLGHHVNRKRIQRLMRKMGIQSVAPKPGTSLPNKEHKVYPYLLRGLEINRADHVWSTDITYLRLQGGFVYLAAVIAWYSRQVLSWEVSATMDDSFCVSALERGARSQLPDNLFSDVATELV